MRALSYIVMTVLFVQAFAFAEVRPDGSEPHEGRWFLQSVKAPENIQPRPDARPVVVAIVDDAVRTSHRDLKDFIWKNPREIPDNNIDDDGNGCVDDVHGWDISDGDNTCAPPRQRLKDFYHGTHLAGVVTQIAEAAYGERASDYIRIMPVKCLSDAANTTYIKDGYKGIRYAVEAKADIILCAWGVGRISAEESAILREANAEGIIVVASAGNFPEDRPQYPAADENVIAVAALDQDNNKVERSNYGGFVDLSAPGIDIESAGVLSDTAVQSTHGSSPAAAIVAAAAAMVKLKDPSYSPEMITAILKDSADAIEAADAEYCAKLGAGKLNINAAMQSKLFVRATAEDNTLAKPQGYLRFQNPDAKFASWNIRPTGRFKGLRFEPVTVDGNAGEAVLSFYTHDAPDAQLIRSCRLRDLGEGVYVAGVSAYITIETENPQPGLQCLIAYRAEPIKLSTLYCSQTEYLNSEGTFQDGSGPNEYSARSDCKWLITAPEGRVINLKFTRFDTQAKRDLVYFFDGEGTHERIMAIFSGAEIPPELTTWRNKVLVWFVTDSEQQGLGFEAEYRFVDPPRFTLTEYDQGNTK